ncbi:uncharacterized protein LOC120277102 [Dioscorea cayenensis subsp. rotundata]|uniref:Uncharacterized protein LOC120277102 n=1 Tax=Dioscorea cayennensis subsp. rotundata TaxID=55577 RepID=A0AB40CNP6_DIOCR|nr:uncharacterized protein LOC120277102 [Dioscorea cayenensis subsp. rotundata]
MLTAELRQLVFPIEFHNLQELQLLVDSMTDENLDAVYGFFHLCPCPSIERLFIQMRGKKEEDPVHANHAIKAMETPQDIDFSHLRVIKMTNFKGWRNEIRLLKFLLEKALCLESLIILVAPLVENGMDLVSQNKQLSESQRLAILSGQISMLPKASSQAQIILCDSSQDDKRIQPVHQGVNHEYNHSEDRYDLISSIRSGVDIQVLI